MREDRNVEDAALYAVYHLQLQVSHVETLSMLLRVMFTRRPQPPLIHRKELDLQMDMWPTHGAEG